MIRSLRRLSCALALALLAPAAHAAEPDAATTRMRERFHEGVKAYDANDYEHALDDFRAAYAAKPSPIIKQNIALCLRALGRDVEAIDTLQSMLVEGGDSLKPASRDLAAKAIAEMLAVIATAKIVVNASPIAGAPPVAADVYVDDTLLAADKQGEPLRLDPGPHRFRARATGYVDAEKDVELSQGQRDIVVTLDLVVIDVAAAPSRGGLRVKVSTPDAAVVVDAGAPQKVGAPFELSPGTHRVSVTAVGYAPYVADVTVIANQTTDVDVTLERPLPEPPAFEPEKRAPIPASSRHFYVIGGVVVQSEALTLSPALDEGPKGGRHQFSGAGAMFEVGRSSRYIDVGLMAELGVFTVHSYQSENDPNQAARVTLIDWVLAPELRFHTNGKVHVLTGVALGVEGTSLSATLGESGGTQSHTSGSGIGLTGMLEGGAGFDLVRTTIEVTAFADVHGVGGVKSDGDALLLDSPAVRGGLRVKVLYRF